MVNEDFIEHKTYNKKPNTEGCQPLDTVQKDLQALREALGKLEPRTVILNVSFDVPEPPETPENNSLTNGN